jgi:hypothetical protein
VTKVDKLQGDIRDLRAQVEVVQTDDSTAKLARANQDATELLAYLQTKANEPGKNSEHYRRLAQTTAQVSSALSSIRAAPGPADAELAKVEATLVQLTQQPPYTLLSMRVVEIGLPLIACVFSLLSVLGYGLTETRSREIKLLLERRQGERADPAAV